MNITVRQMTASDRTAWVEMRSALWPEDAPEAHVDAANELLNSGENWGLIAETLDREIAGFAEIAVRKYANGCDTKPVGFLEGIWVKPKFRRQGIGAQLIKKAEALLVECGFHELGSDTPINNRDSQAAHLAWGFSETERVVYFRKVLAPTRD
jgi:aminoglycoside 6'-N-acetyltransferase I